MSYIALVNMAASLMVSLVRSNMGLRQESIGYGRLPSKLNLDGDLCIFRHFAELNIRNVLYLQSELQELELVLQQLDTTADGDTSEPSKWFKSRSYHHASNGTGTAPEGDTEYRRIVFRVREVLEKYSAYFISCGVSKVACVPYT